MAQRILTNYMVNIPGLKTAREATTITEVTMTESLSTPGLQTSLILQSQVNTPFNKNLDEYYDKPLQLWAERNVLRDYSDVLKTDFNTTQRIYRLSQRTPENYSYETFQLDTCDDSLLIDASQYMSRSWFKKTPTQVVSDVFSSVFPNSNVEVEETTPVQDYIAEYIHPFQVINQMTERALSSNYDPSLLHFMTYQNKAGNDIPTHNFRSISNMAKADPVFSFVYNGKVSTNDNYADPHDIMQYSFPRDFDLLNDILNGANGDKPFVQMNLLNPLTSRVSAYGPVLNMLPGNTPYLEPSNKGTEDIQNSSPLTSDRIKLLRRARMNLISNDSIGLRMIVPFSPFLNVGRTINATFLNTTTGEATYGSGKYLIVNMSHNIKFGGLGITTLECVSNTVAHGEL